MTAFTVSAARFISRRTFARAKLIIATILCIVMIGSLFLVGIRAQSDAATLTVDLPAEHAAALIDATSGPATADMRAVGEEARAFNAALPFASDALRSARPFELSGNTIDQRRALLCLTQAIYYEAGFEPVEGRRAVAQVVLNRSRHPAFPKSICGVVYQGSGTRVCQFTFVCDGALNRAPGRRAWLEAESIARAALSGFVDSSVGEATHYHADYVTPRWAPLLAKVAQIGQHIFYRWPGAWGQPSAFTGKYIGEPRDPLSLRPPPLEASGGEDALDVAAADASSGPPTARAPNDVGGLLDTSKGWTLSIPGPHDSNGSASRLIAAQEGENGQSAQMMSASMASAEAGPR